MSAGLDQPMVQVELLRAQVGVSVCEGCDFHLDALDSAAVAGLQSDSAMHAITTGHVVNETVSTSTTVRPLP